MEELKVPAHFKSEKEEADWWYDHRNELGNKFVRAAKSGALRRGTVSRLVAESRVSGEFFTPADLELAKNQAQAAGVDPADYIRSLLHDALLRQEEEQKKHSA